MNYPNWFEMTAKHNFQTYLAEFKDKPNLKFLQLGVYTGDASVWLCNNILTVKGSVLIDVDTWQEVMRKATPRWTLEMLSGSTRRR
jgi:hypothetical protein